LKDEIEKKKFIKGSPTKLKIKRIIIEVEISITKRTIQKF
jgi:hypothetical protein